MARNEEKALSVLNRWTKQQEEMEKYGSFGGPKERRPRLAEECNSLKQCEFWRRDLIKEISRKISEIQNAGLGEHRIRDLNDEINRLLRAKHHWEEQILKLGGTDYKKSASSVDTFGTELVSNEGYKYFGAAKDLPGVRELWEQQQIPNAPRKTRKEMMKNIQPDYYGWRDEEDGKLLTAEAEAEAKMINAAVEEWQAKAGVAATSKKAAEPSEVMQAYVSVPSVDDIKELMLERKKQALLEKYVPKETEEQVAKKAVVDKYMSKEAQEKQAQAESLVKGQ